MNELEAFKQQVETFISLKGIAARTLGIQAGCGPSFVFQLRNGREPGSRVRKKVIDFIRRESQKT